ncbi:MAG: EAL domain-containing protein, partial [Pseudomonadota bacterium]
MKIESGNLRYGPAVMFVAGLAGAFLIGGSILFDWSGRPEIWGAAAYIAIFLIYAHTHKIGGATPLEKTIVKGVVERVQEDPGEGVKQAAPALKLDADYDLPAKDIATLERVRSAIESDRLELYLQPIVSLPQRKIRHYEAFSRLRDLQGGVLKPSDYLHAAERANQIGVVDSLILLKCVQALKSLSEGGGPFSVFCNVSPATLFDGEFFSYFDRYLSENADFSARLIFELTSPAVQIMHPMVEKRLAALAEKGFAFSIDHVASLDQDWTALRARNFRYVKAPSALLVKACAGDAQACRRLEDFRRKLADAGVDLIAEKIENEDDLPEIVRLGLDFGQG